jgi:hypothetical protein
VRLDCAVAGAMAEIRGHSLVAWSKPYCRAVRALIEALFHVRLPPLPFLTSQRWSNLKNKLVSRIDRCVTVLS